MTDVTYVLAFVILAADAAIVALITWYWPGIKAKLNLVKMENLQFWIDIGIYAYEKLIQGYKKGAERKEAVKQFLNRHGFDADMEVVSIMIDAGVEKMNQQLIKLKDDFINSDEEALRATTDGEISE